MEDDKKVAIVTGANKGIGLAIVKALCKDFDGIVYLTARDYNRGKGTINMLKQQAASVQPKFHTLDVDNMESIKKLQKHIKTTYGGFDVLVNNAAIAYKLGSTVPFGEQATNTINVNFFGTLNVCRELFPLLRPHARVVNLSSSEGRVTIIPNADKRAKFLNPALTEKELCDLMNQFVKDAQNNEHHEKGWAPSAYQVSKIGVTALTFIQQRQFNEDEREDLIVNAVHPGYCNTDMTSHRGPLTPEQGAEAPVYLALLPPNVESPKGEFIWNDKTVAKWC